MKTINIMLSIMMISIFMVSCKKDTSEPTTNYPLSVRMTDAPGPYNAVFIDLQGVEITGSNGKAVLMNVNTGIYNLLAYSNGMDTLIATGSLNVATVSQIRLILGPNNSVMVDSVLYPLDTPSADQSGLKLQVHQTLQAGVLYSILLDFDANKSIVMTGNGTYKLKPVIRTIETAISGAIRGSITPAGTLAVVTATSASSVTYTSNVNAAGDFLLMGLPAGMYSVTITPQAPFNEVTLNNIAVSTGNTTIIGTVTL